MVDFINVYDFGAKGDGITDDTSAIQAAIDKGAELGKTVYFTSGKFLVGELFVRPASVLKADAQWGYRDTQTGNSVLLQKDENQECVLDVSFAHGSTIDGLSIVGKGEGGVCHGIYSRKKDYGKVEDAYRIQNCKVAKFTGHAVYLDKVWCFTARHNMFCYSNGDGLNISGWDGFVSDNWFSGNKGAGFGTTGSTCAVTMTGNRIEWNAKGGIVINGGSHYNITGNYMDRSGLAGIILGSYTETDENGEINIARSNTITCTGNVIFRSGKSAEDNEESTHILLDKCVGVTVVGNSLCVGRDDKHQGKITPLYGMVLNDLCECVVTNNTMFCGCTKELVLDKQNHHGGVVVNNNTGSLCPQDLMDGNYKNFPSTNAIKGI